MTHTQNHAMRGNSRKISRNVISVDRELSGQRPMCLIRSIDAQEAEPQDSSLRGGAS